MSDFSALRERFASVLCVLACGCLAVYSLALVYSDLAMSKPSAAILAWENGDSMSNHQHRRALLARMGRAIAVHPLDAQPRMELGRFFAWHAARHRAGSQRAVFYHRLAAERFAEAVLSRPTWGYAWALLAEQWAASGQPDSKIAWALRRAITLSAFEPGAQLKALWLGLGRWGALDETLRAQMIASLSRLASQRTYFAQAARIALHHRQEGLLRDIAVQPWQREQISRMVAAATTNLRGSRP